jgi:TatD DNase family protein
MFCDTHCHLFKEYYDDILSVIKNANLNNVNRMIVAGVSNESNHEVMDVINNTGVFGVLGIHPESVEDYSDEDLKFIEDNLVNEKIVGIGEIGLDYHFTKENKMDQIELFKKQLKMAEEYNVPVVIHSRDATEDTINILKEFNVRGVIHSFSGSLETAKIYIKMGFLLGVNGVITFKNCNLKDVITEIPLENIVIETDSPYLTPVPFRGKKNEPCRVINVASFICDLKEVGMDELSLITNKNIKRIFDI